MREDVITEAEVTQSERFEDATLPALRIAGGHKPMNAGIR